MSSFTFNNAKGKVARYCEQHPGNIKVLLLTASGLEADANLKDRNSVAAIGFAGNTEASFTGYARGTLSGVVVAASDTTNVATVDADDEPFTNSGSPAAVKKAVTFYDPGTGDTDCIPLTCHDWDVTVQGVTTLQWPAGGFWQAQDV